MSSVITCPHCKSEFLTVKRSNTQSKYFHLLIGLIAKETGNNFNETKTGLKIKFGFYEEKLNSFTGRNEIILEETSTMNKQRMSELIDYCFHFANADLGMQVPSCAEFLNQAA